MKPVASRKMKAKKLETVEGKGVTIPIFSSPVGEYESYRLVYYSDGGRVRERATSLDAARKRARELIDQLADGTAHVSSLTPKQHAALDEALGILDKRAGGVTFLEAIRQYADAYQAIGGPKVVEAAEFYAKAMAERQKKEALIPIKFPALVDKLMLDIKQDKSRRYVYDMQARLAHFATVFKSEILDIQTADIDLAISSIKVSGRTKNNYRNCLITAFSFARDKRHLPRELKTEAEFSKRYKEATTQIGIYSPKEYTLILNNVNPKVIPFFALGGFAGMRSAEIARLRWPDIHWQGMGGYVQVGADQSKTATRRLIPILPALAAWLKPFAKEDGFVLPGMQDEFHLGAIVRKALREVTDADGKILVEPVANGARHSFCSYRMADVKSAAQVSMEAGNSPKILHHNYREVATVKEGKTFLIDAKAAKAWFGIMPAAGRIIEIKDYLKAIKATQGKGKPNAKKQAA